MCSVKDKKKGTGKSDKKKALKIKRRRRKKKWTKIVVKENKDCTDVKGGM